MLEYKMLMKFQKRKTPDDDVSSTTSTLENNDLILYEENNDLKPEVKNNTPITIETIRHKTDLYARELAHRAERYERTKTISLLVYTIQNSTKRLTNLQKNKYYYLLNKYPDNELLLSIKNIVPEIKIKQPKPIKPIKQSKKKIKKVDEDSTHNNIENVSYPIIKYEDKTSSNNLSHSLQQQVSQSIIKPSTYPIIIYGY